MAELELPNLQHSIKSSEPDELQSGPKVLDHSDVYRDFPISPFSVLIQTIMTCTDATVERNIETRVGRGDFILRQEFGIMLIPSHNGQKLHFSAVNG